MPFTIYCAYGVYVLKQECLVRDLRMVYFFCAFFFMPFLVFSGDCFAYYGKILEFIILMLYPIFFYIVFFTERILTKKKYSS